MMISCPFCNSLISSYAQRCPKCQNNPSTASLNILKKQLIDEVRKESITPAQKLAFTKEGIENEMRKSTPKQTTNAQKTELFAIISFAAGLGGFLILPILFVPIGYIAAVVSYYRINENKQEWKGHGLRITGALLTTANILWLMYQFRIGFFSRE